MSIDDTEFTTGPVPESATVAWWRVAMISAMVAFSLPTFITGLEVSRAVSLDVTLLALAGGSLMLTLIAGITGSIGARTRLSSYMLARVAFGDRGAALVNLAFAVSLLGWFGVNIDLFSAAVERLSRETFGLDVPVWVVELGAGGVMTATTVYGFRAINGLSLLLVPVLVAVTVSLIASALHVVPLADMLSRDSIGALSLGDAMSSVVGGVVVGAVILPDITRFIRRWPGAVYTAVLSYLIIGCVVMAAGSLAATALDRDDLLEIMLIVGLGWGAFAIVIAGSWVLNSLNLYSTMLSIEATWPALQSRLLVVVLGTLGTLAAFLNILDVFLTFLFYLAIVFVPVAGVIAVDYLFVRRAAYHDERTVLSSQWRPYAIAAWALGACVALLGAEGVLRLSGFAALDAMLVAAGAYWIAARLNGSGA
ncbi:MAG: cytosine permease [Pseudomonadota bacterium]